MDGRPRPANRIGRYEVVGHLATGGMAEILLARLTGPSGFERPVVLKRVLPSYVELRAFVDMFVDEARIAAQIRHPNVVTVHELGEDGAELFLAMEYLEGESLSSVLRRLFSRGRRLSASESAYVMAEACAGLHAAHELTDATGAPLDVVHRDVSPQNVFVTYHGRVKVLDFGVARAKGRITRTEAGQLKGKFEYMSPEQCAGAPLDRRSDIFGLGVVAYELITRHRLFRRESPTETLRAVQYDPIPALGVFVPDCPAPLEAAVLCALSRDPRDRFQTANDFRRELLAHVQPDDLGRYPEESLASAMTELFRDRIEEKRELLTHVRAGSVVGPIPKGEVDLNVELPTVSALEVSFVEPPRARWPVRTALLALVALALAAVLVLWAGYDGSSHNRPVAKTLEARVPPREVKLASEPLDALVVDDPEPPRETPRRRASSPRRRAPSTTPAMRPTFERF